jgi:hypothetical protein
MCYLVTVKGSISAGMAAVLRNRSAATTKYRAHLILILSSSFIELKDIFNKF